MNTPPAAPSGRTDTPEVEPVLFEYHGGLYPDYIRNGNACQFIVPAAQQFCKGEGLDIGGYMTWTFPGARPVNVAHNDGFDAYNLPEGPENGYDYIFSSHTLEHLDNYVKALQLWKETVKKKNGVVFLYLPSADHMPYWRPQFNRKHLHHFKPQEMAQVLRDLGFAKVIHTEGHDLYWSFAVVGIT